MAAPFASKFRTIAREKADGERKRQEKTENGNARTGNPRNNLLRTANGPDVAQQNGYTFICGNSRTSNSRDERGDEHGTTTSTPPPRLEESEEDKTGRTSASCCTDPVPYDRVFSHTVNT